MRKLRVLDLFSGIGGFSLGLERTGGFETVAFCEIDPFCRRVLAKHWPHVRQFEDVTKLKGEDVGPVDVICGGFPCQDISHAGKGAGIEGQRSGLWSEYARLVGELRPSYVIVENVSALLGRGIDRVLGDLAEIGFDAEWHCIPASAVGAPHIRDRVWIIAYPQHSDANRTGPHRAGMHVNGSAEPGNEQEREPRSMGAVLANANVIGRDGSGSQSSGRAQSENSRTDVADANIKRLEGRNRKGVRKRAGQQPSRPRSALANADSFAPVGAAIARTERNPWLVEPDVGRVANGVPSRVDRLRALGNAVVPQIPELIGRAILAAQEAAA